MSFKLQNNKQTYTSNAVTSAWEAAGSLCCVRVWATGSMPCLCKLHAVAGKPSSQRPKGLFWITYPKGESINPVANQPSLVSCNSWNCLRTLLLHHRRLFLCPLSGTTSANLWPRCGYKHWLVTIFSDDFSLTFSSLPPTPMFSLFLFTCDLRSRAYKILWKS